MIRIRPWPIHPLWGWALVIGLVLAAALALSSRAFAQVGAGQIAFVRD